MGKKERGINIYEHRETMQNKETNWVEIEETNKENTAGIKRVAHLIVVQYFTVAAFWWLN